MARLARVKVKNEIAWYHVCSRVAGWIDWYPMDDPVAKEKFLSMLQKYLQVFCCEAAAFCLMGNHYHLVLRFQPFRPLPKKELLRRAEFLYRDPESVLLTDSHFQRFNRRIFDLSEFMRSLQSEFARWYNKTHNRRGSFWSERFKSVLLGDGESILDAILYVELNPVRAGLTKRPDDWRWSSAHNRAMASDYWLYPLSKILPDWKKNQVRSIYRHLLYLRGGLDIEENNASLLKQIIRRESGRGFKSAGAFQTRLDFFTNGLVIGSEKEIKIWIEKLNLNLRYKRKKIPIKHDLGGGNIFSIRGYSLKQECLGLTFQKLFNFGV